MADLLCGILVIGEIITDGISSWRKRVKEGRYKKTKDQE